MVVSNEMIPVYICGRVRASEFPHTYATSEGGLHSSGLVHVLVTSLGPIQSHRRGFRTRRATCRPDAREQTQLDGLDARQSDVSRLRIPAYLRLPVPLRLALALTLSLTTLLLALALELPVDTLTLTLELLCTLIVFPEKLLDLLLLPVGALLFGLGAATSSVAFLLLCLVLLWREGYKKHGKC